MFKKGQSGNPKGRPKGTTTIPRFASYVSEGERKKFVEFILDQYMGDMRLAIWLGNQLFGTPTQAIELTGKDGADLIPNEKTTIQLWNEEFREFVRAKDRSTEK